MFPPLSPAQHVTFGEGLYFTVQRSQSFASVFEDRVLFVWEREEGSALQLGRNYHSSPFLTQGAAHQKSWETLTEISQQLFCWQTWHFLLSDRHSLGWKIYQLMTGC